jgi:WhiB family redox-sensing transcriptional regulator
MRYEDVRWEDAACRGTDTEAFYPINGLPMQTVIRICQGCPIRNDCASYAIEHEQYGYWANMAEITRREIRMGRRKRAA